MFPKAHDIGPRLEELTALANEMGISEYTLHYVFFMICSEVLLERYREEGISEDIYWNTIVDLRCKAYECKENYGIWGTFVEGWFDRFYRMERFGLGRFQFFLLFRQFCRGFIQLGMDLLCHSGVQGINLLLHQLDILLTHIYIYILHIFLYDNGSTTSLISSFVP